MKKTLSLIALVLATAATSFAVPANSSKNVIAPAQETGFHGNEWQLDAGVSGAGGNYNSKTGGGVGGNIGINYFFNRYIGIGLDTSIGGFWPSSGQNAQTVDSLQAELYLRYPIDSLKLAPYAMIGGGGNWGGASQGDGNIGGGVEWRFANNMGLFADCRWLYGGSNGIGQLSMALPRVGLRFNF